MYNICNDEVIPMNQNGLGESILASEDADSAKKQELGLSFSISEFGCIEEHV